MARNPKGIDMLMLSEKGSLPHIGTGFPGKDLEEMFLTLKPSLPHLLLCFYLTQVGSRHFLFYQELLLPCLTEYHFYIFVKFK